MARKFTAQEEARLKKLHPALLKVVRLAATRFDFKIGETDRTIEKQRDNNKSYPGHPRVSWTMDSRHLIHKDGYAHAVDLMCLVDGKPTFSWPPYHELAKVMFQCARELGVTIRWGGNWKYSYTKDLGHPADGPHFEVAKDYPIGAVSSKG